MSGENSALLKASVVGQFRLSIFDSVKLKTSERLVEWALLDNTSVRASEFSELNRKQADRPPMSTRPTSP